MLEIRGGAMAIPPSSSKSYHRIIVPDMPVTLVLLVFKYLFATMYLLDDISSFLLYYKTTSKHPHSEAHQLHSYDNIIYVGTFT